MDNSYKLTIHYNDMNFRINISIFCHSEDDDITIKLSIFSQNPNFQNFLRARPPSAGTRKINALFFRPKLTFFSEKT